ncbi:MAG: hypothetical protein Q8823_02325, partial [Candidatus Phytoplasma australasiaticum]|nr:hypothetical protein [Candidatus Phytoplasma australasiaticum]
TTVSFAFPLSLTAVSFNPLVVLLGRSKLRHNSTRSVRCSLQLLPIGAFIKIINNNILMKLV